MASQPGIIAPSFSDASRAAPADHVGSCTRRPEREFVAPLKRGGCWAMLVMVCIAGNAPLLRRMEFSNTQEGLNVATALEIRRTGHWLIPTLDGHPRTNKPPLPAWITALAIRQTTLRAIADPDASIRRAGFEQLAWDARWPAMLAAALMLVATFEFALAIDGKMRSGLIAALVLLGMFLFLKHARTASIDIYLALFVTLTNVFLARAVLEGRIWTGAIGAGVAAGLAFLCKGPVALLMSVAPAALYATWSAIGRDHAPPRRERLGSVLAGAMCWAVVALPWFAVVSRDLPSGQISGWVREVTGEDAPERQDAPWTYAIASITIAPWLVYFVAGAVTLSREALRPRTVSPASRRALLALLLCVVPIAALLLFKDKKERYLLPLTMAMAAVVAYQLGERESSDSRSRRRGDALSLMHWTVVLAMIVGLLFGGAIGVDSLRTESGQPWYSWSFANSAALAMGAMLAGVVLMHRRASGPLPIVVGTAVIMLGWNAVMISGYQDSAAGRFSDRLIAEEIWARYPNAEVYFVHPIHGNKPPPSLSVYLNRPVKWLSPEKWRSLRAASSREPLVVLTPAASSSIDTVTPPSAQWALASRLERPDEPWLMYVLQSAQDDDH